MIRHVVMWRVHGDDETTRHAHIEEMIAALRGCAGLPGIQAFEVSRAAGFGSTHDVMLDSCFDDAAALAAYQIHPTHAAILPRMRELAAERACVDFEA